MTDTFTCTLSTFHFDVLPKELLPCKVTLVHNIFLRFLDAVLCTTNCCHIRTVLYYKLTVGVKKTRVVGYCTARDKCSSGSIVTATVFNKT